MTGTVGTGVAEQNQAGIEERKRTARRLIGSGRGFAEEYDFRVSNNPANLFQLLYLSLLLTVVRDHRRAVRIAQAVREQGGQSALQLARAPLERRVAAVRSAGHRRDATGLAVSLGELAEVVLDRYQGDLRRLRTQARRDPARERELLGRLPGVGDRVIDLFFREAQSIWTELAPFADRQALATARRLGLGRSTADLAALAGRPGSERFAWLVGALARVAVDDGKTRPADHRG